MKTNRPYKGLEQKFDVRGYICAEKKCNNGGYNVRKGKLLCDAHTYPKKDSTSA